MKVLPTLIGLLTLVAGCASSGADTTVPQPAPEPAPWVGASLKRSDIAPAYVTAWNAAQNRNTCALVAFANTALIGNATARTATFSGGWAVAYDRADSRSAFGIAGSGSSASDSTYQWPNNITWADGSTATYGPEGGTGPNQLAYLRIRGQGCLYNVWSRLGREHLEGLLESIRMVAP
jgi:hypothetical protein